ncbi:MAG: MATE family efflux transporter [Treponema sp.]|nr:MATE family efflux transporter [Treponema sp.]
MKTPLIGTRQFYRNMLGIGVPIALQTLLANSTGIVDTLMIGTQGELAVAAVGICAQFGNLMFAGYFGFCNGGTIFIAQYWGAKDEKGICRSYGIMLSCMMAVSFGFGALAVFAPEFIMGIYTDKESISGIGVTYLRIIGFNYPISVFAVAIGSLLRSIEKVRIPLFASIVSVFTNIILNWLLILGNLGFPKLGVPGAAIASVCSNIVHVIVLYAFCIFDRGTFILRIRDQFRWGVSFIQQFFTKSFFIVCNEIFFGTGQLILNIIIGRQAEAGIAAIAVFRVLESFIFVFFVGFSGASAVMVGAKVGAGNHLDAYTEAKQFILACPALTLLVCLILLPFREQVFTLFGLGAEAVSYAKTMLLIYTLTGTLRSCNFITNNVFRSAGESVFGTAVELMSLYFVTIPVTAIAGMLLHFPFLVVFFMIFADEFVRIYIIQRYLYSGKWVKPVTREGLMTIDGFRKLMQKNGAGE